MYAPRLAIVLPSDNEEEVLSEAFKRLWGLQE